jgi:hypothetical protein
MTQAKTRLLVLILSLSPALLRAQAPPSPAIWTIPGIANVPGQNGTQAQSAAGER